MQLKNSLSRVSGRSRKRIEQLEKLNTLILPSHTELFVVSVDLGILIEETRALIREMEEDVNLSDQQLAFLNKSLMNAKEHLRLSQKAVAEAHLEIRGEEPNMVELYKKYL